MIGLVLDTTIKGALLGAVTFDDKAWRLVASLSVEDNVAATARLPLLVTDVLAKAAVIQMQDLAFLAVGQGPGSFTGIKIGLAFAQGFALGGQTAGTSRLLAVSALACMAQQAWQEGQAAGGDMYFLPATRTEGYGAHVGEDGSVSLLAVSVRGDGVWIRGEHEAEGAPVQQGAYAMRRAVLVQAWPGMLPWCVEMGIKAVEAEFSKMANTIIMGMAGAAVAAWRQGLRTPIVPRYFRLSAPEEKLLTTAKDVT